MKIFPTIEWADNEYMNKKLRCLAKGKYSSIDGCYRYRNIIMLNNRLRGNRIKLFCTLAHELFHHFTRFNNNDNIIGDIFDYVSYGWRIKDGKWKY